MAFMMVVAGAMLLDYILKQSKYKKILMIVLGSVFLLDQFYQTPKSVSPELPTQLYAQIAKDQDDSSVLEIPFTVRDGFR